MIVVDLLCPIGRVQQLEEVSPLQALFIGLVQTLSAVFPGTSRSMSTIASGQLTGLSRPIALEFSFLVSIPIMFVATFYDLFKYMKENSEQASLSAHQAGVLAMGFCVSFVVAYAVVAWFLAYVRQRGFVPFGIYRIAMGAALYLFLLR
jgi:undecaprenyl-diphosphatase